MNSYNPFKSAFFSMTKNEWVLFVFLIFTAGFSLSIQLLTIVVFSTFHLLKKNKILYINRWLFYSLILFISLSQLLLIWSLDYSVNYVLNTLIIVFMWFIALQCSNIIVLKTVQLDSDKIEQVLIKVFVINFIVVILQILRLMLISGTLNPFVVDSAGDHISGLFSFSSSNMIVMSFYSIFFYYKKYYKLLLLAIVVIALTFFMSGILLFLTSLFLYTLSKFSFSSLIKYTFITLIGIYMFSIFSPGNITYAMNILTIKIGNEDDPARKVIATQQTIDYWTDDWNNFIFGAGGGKFSSRTAFITAGEYVSYPNEFKYLSSDFRNNHFELWNKDILSADYKDGTANQPFSFYHKMIGEYGLIGIVLFMLYLFTYIPFYKKLTFGKAILIGLLLFLYLDYWFEYFTIFIFFLTV